MRGEEYAPPARWVFCEQGIVILIFSYLCSSSSVAEQMYRWGVGPRFQCLLNM